MHTKMLELAEKIEEKAQRWQESACEKSVTGDGSRYAIPKHAVANALMDLSHDIRSIFTPRDWREGCVVCRSIVPGLDSWWGVYSPDGKYTLFRRGWTENRSGVIGNDSGFYSGTSEENEKTAHDALASCPTPYPGYKENTCDTSPASGPQSNANGTDGAASPATSVPSAGSKATTSTEAVQPTSAAGADGSSEKNRTTSNSTNTLIFGGPALRVAFHFDGDRLVRWEILEQREELRGSQRLSDRLLSGAWPHIYEDGSCYLRGVDRKFDNSYSLGGTHTRATITALGAEIDQVNREWCEKLGIGDGPTPKAERDYAYSLVEAAKEEIESLRRQLDAAEKVIDSVMNPNVSYSQSRVDLESYRATYPKNGGAS